MANYCDCLYHQGPHCEANHRHFLEKEQQALAAGANRRELEQRLRAAAGCLHNGREFGRGVFNFEERTLTGNNGLVLEWKVRAFPERPESYMNQQTTTGCVVIR